MHRPSPDQLVLLALSVALVVLLALRLWRHRSPADSEVDVKAELQVTRNRGWTFFHLVVLNRSRMKIAVVDATLTVTDLVAKFQATPATDRTTLKIRHIVKPGDTLCADVVELFYIAAGKPQRGYSFTTAATIRFRAHGDLFEQLLPVYRVKMFALSPNGLERVRGNGQPGGASEHLQGLPDLEPADLKWLEAEAGTAA